MQGNAWRNANECISVLAGNVTNNTWDGDYRLMIDRSCIQDCNANWQQDGYNSNEECIATLNCDAAWLNNINGLNPFDINNDGYVELPFSIDPMGNNQENQQDQYGQPYTKARVLKHTVTHEIGHAMGDVSHTTDPNCVMYEWSNNWRRDDYISDEFRAKLKVHNVKR